MPAAGNGWIPFYTTNIGITFTNPPNNGVGFSKVNGTVSQPEVLQKMGFPNVLVGDKITVAHEESLKLNGTNKALDALAPPIFTKFL